MKQTSNIIKIPSDFLWETYLNINKDLKPKNFDKEKAIEHLLHSQNRLSCVHTKYVHARHADRPSQNKMALQPKYMC